MKVLNDYIQDIRRLFFISIDTTPNKWVRIDDDVYVFKYGNWSEDKFSIDLNKSTLYIGDLSESKDIIVISKYRRFFVTDSEIYRYVKKLKVYFKTEDENTINRKKISKLNDGVTQLMKIYKNEYDRKLRKDKIENIENK